MTTRRPILLTPGPVQTSAAVRGALAESDFCHRDVAFRELAARVVRRLTRLLEAPDHDLLLLSGGGTSATEASLATFLAPDDEILIVSNGAFAERIAEVAELLGARPRQLAYGWGEAIDPDDVERFLDSHPEARYLAMVHHETSVGALNPVHRVGEILHERGVRYIVDAVSSVGAEELSVARGHVGLVIGSANKCLHGVAGVSFVAVRRSWWEALGEIPPRSLFLDLRRYRDALAEGETSPFTPPVSPIVALARALEELDESGGPEARRAHYERLSGVLRQGLRDLGIEPSNGVPRSSAMTLARLPEGVEFDAFQRELREAGYVIDPVKGALRASHCIVANMGAVDLGTIEGFLAAVRRVLA